MLGNFTFHNPTKLYFGENSLENLSKELGKYGEKVMLVYGGGSIRKNGIYDAVLAELRKAGKQTVELSGVMPNPTIEKVMEGVALARKEAVDFILAVGGGSVCDYCKAVAGSAYCEHDPWEYYFNNWGEMTCRWIPVGCVLTMAGTGSEMDSCSVISKHSKTGRSSIISAIRISPFSIPLTLIPCPSTIRWQAFTTSCRTYWNNIFRERTTTRPTTSPKG